MKTHSADKINQSGGVSALCFKKPRAISLSVATWTIVDEQVTCRKCLNIMELARDLENALKAKRLADDSNKS